jgi:SsrA-binding protein
MSTLAKNKKAYFNYEILETYEAGIVLFGFEVKSVKLGRISLDGAYISIRNNEAYLLNAAVPPYQSKNTPASYDPSRLRKLLLKRAEIAELTGKSSTQGLTLLPLSVYTKKGKIKVEIGVARGKRKYEKREKIKRKDAMEEIDRALKSGM